MSEVVKISVIRANASDGLNNIVEYVQKASNQKVFLVLPVDNDLVHSKIGLKTLKKKALEAKKELIVSFPTEASVKQAQELGLVATTVSDVKDVSPLLWQQAHKELLEFTTNMLYGEQNTGRDTLSGHDFKESVNLKKESKDASTAGRSAITGLKLDAKKLKSEKNLKPLFIIGGLGFLLIATILASMFFIYYKFFPRLYITLVFNTTPIHDQYTITGDSKLEGINVDKASIGINETVLTEEETITKDVTTEVEEGTYATGVVRIFNSDSVALDVPLGTVFETNGKQYVSTQAVSVAPAQTVDVSVKARKIGEEYNIPSMQHFTIQLEAYDSTKHQVTNPNAFTGGSKTKVKVVTQEEVNKAVEEIKTALKERLKSLLLEHNRDQGYHLIGDSVAYKVLETKVEPNIGEKADQFTVTVKMQAKAYFYKEGELNDIVEQIILQKYGKDSDSSVQVKDLEIKIDSLKFDKNKKKAIIKVKAEGTLGTEVTEDQVWEIIKDLKYSEIESALYEHYKDELKSVEITFTPNWIPKKIRYIPSEQTRVSIYIKH